MTSSPSRSTPLPFAIGDVLRLRKPHPCGGTDWTVVRLGADIGIRCNTCQRKVLLPRRTLERRLKTVLEHGPADPSGGTEMSPGSQSRVEDVTETTE